MKHELYIRKGFECFLPCLADFAEREMKKRYPNSWKEECIVVLRNLLPGQAECETEYKMRLSVGDWFKLIHSKSVVFGAALSELDGAWITELWDCWDKCANIGQIDFSKEYALRSIETMELLSDKLSFACAGSIRSIYNKLKCDEGPKSPVSQSPSNRPPRNFAKGETAILLNELIKVRELGKDRGEAIRCVSKKLRKKAVNAGYNVLEEYRDLRGIESQMRIMEAALEHRDLGSHGIPALFREIVDIYNTDRAEFERILKVALQDCCDNPESQ